ncbi:MAG: rhodanese-like domain-containing protein [Actinomycetota bacterium]|nr:rhodanese-like domain-containing protein [Actinomycetota bacterium]
MQCLSVPIIPIIDHGLGNSSYVVDLGDRRLAVIDPGRHPGPFLAESERRGARIAFSVETHLHADFVTGSRELAASGATVVAPAGAGLGWPHRPLAGGDAVDFGGLILAALATPGHTPEHLAYVLSDGQRPVAVFSGGSLLVGTVARTDLIAPEATEDLARALWRSLRDQLLVLPDDIVVFPTHGAGSFCSAPGDARRWTTIGDERRSNPMLGAPDEDAFVSTLLDSFGTYPSYFRHLREVNRAGPAVLGARQPVLEALDVEAFRRRLHEGAVLIDARPVEIWTGGHIPGSIAIPLRDQFASWLGWLVERDQPLVFLVGADQDRVELVRQCHQIGYDELAGELAGGITAWVAAGLELRRTPVVDADSIAGRVLDVRQDSEYATGHVPGSVHVELGRLASAAAEIEPADAVMCAHGERAATAASLLERAGRPGVAVVVGGPDDWAAGTGRPLSRR